MRFLAKKEGMRLLKGSLACCCLILFFYGCHKADVLDTSPSTLLGFSATTVTFDTVFTARGSATKNFIIRNPSKNTIKISHISLAEGVSSPFRININGVAGSDFRDVEIAGGDSIFAFAEVTIDPNDQQKPFIVRDSILFELNGNRQDVKLTAYGQNAHYFNSFVVRRDTTWKNDLPIVIVNSVGIGYKTTLTIEAGATIYSHSGSAIVVGGSLNVKGTKDNPVIFRGDRREQKYKDEPGQWYGMQFLNQSSNNNIVHAVIQNASVGIEVDSMPPAPATTKLSIQKTIIKNMSSAGIYALGTIITGQDLLMYACGQSVLYCDLGGQYKFANCTFDNSNPPSAQPQSTIILGNTDYSNSTIFLQGNLSASFRDCIIWGNIDDEVTFVRKGTGAFIDTFQYNVVKSKTLNFDGTNVVNKDPMFKNFKDGQYQPSAGSPAANSGVLTSFSLPDDIDDVKWILTPDNKMAIGAYQF